MVVGLGVLINQQGNNCILNDNVVAIENNSINIEKVNAEDASGSDAGSSKDSSGDSKYVSKEYAIEHEAEWNSGHGYYWVGDTQYDSATGKIIGGESTEDQQALMEVMGIEFKISLNIFLVKKWITIK